MPEEDAFYLKRKLKGSPESRYKIFKDASYWYTPKNVDHTDKGECTRERGFSEPTGRIEDEDVIAYYSIPPAQSLGPFEFYGQRLMIKKRRREEA